MDAAVAQMPFCRLTLDLPCIPFVTTTKQIDFGQIVGGKFRGIVYHHIKALPGDVQALLDFLPAEKRRFFELNVMRINTPIPPHIDSGTKTTINLYLQAGTWKTCFYHAPEHAHRMRIKNQTNGCIFTRPDQLREIGSFQAKAGEAWCLDVTKPHAVLPQLDTNLDEDRVALTISTTYFPYQEVMEMLHR